MQFCYDPSFINTDPGVIAQVKANMNNKERMSFDDLRAAINQLDGEPDGVVAQAVIDSGFKTEGE